jgi:hypothetical protein
MYHLSQSRNTTLLSTLLRRTPLRSFMVMVSAGEDTQEAQQLPQNDDHDNDHERKKKMTMRLKIKMMRTTLP